MTTGTYQRAYPRVSVLRGYNPNQPTTLQRAFGIKTGVTILSGQLISTYWNSTLLVYQWDLGVGTAANDLCYVALKDSADPDVVASGSLPALSCAGDFEIQTPFFNVSSPSSYIDGAYLVADGVTGNLIVSTLASATAAAKAILGVVTRNNGLLDIGAFDSGVTPAASAPFVPVIDFITRFQPTTTTA
jgi:hypothetical protein